MRIHVDLNGIKRQKRYNVLKTRKIREQAPINVGVMMYYYSSKPMYLYLRLRIKVYYAH